ncbi:TMV resistance protein N-like [Hevea brasiliensis]|uniref:TMV resistance protein N-like n=1 Tax=Hevea brasiliensis TaxID=3981 RepID=UPI000B784384|nr:TMV resistance protein N-like [Hevea brasiliensis]
MSQASCAICALIIRGNNTSCTPYSPWCLDEPVEILKCNKESKQTIIPFFYRVNPTDVQKLTGNFRKAFAIAVLEEVLDKDSSQKVGNWKRALIEVSNLGGWDSRVTKDEAELVEKIVNDVLEKFNEMSKSDDSYDCKLIGIKSHVEKIEQLLIDENVVGINGMGGIGKTTIAKEVYRRNKNEFDGHHFVEDVKAKKKSQIANDVQKKIIHQLLKKKHVGDLSDFNRRKLKSKKVLIVFYDVDNRDDLKDLVRECDLYCERSRIIVTSRDLQLLKYVCSEEGIYEVEKLTDSQGLKLFSLHAFGQNLPKQEYKELSELVANYSRGNPLALRVLGSHLSDMSIEEWESELEKLKGQSFPEIRKVLQISYDGLGRNEKKIFLDIACFFKGQNKDD